MIGDCAIINFSTDHRVFVYPSVRLSVSRKNREYPGFLGTPRMEKECVAYEVWYKTLHTYEAHVESVLQSYPDCGMCSLW